MLAEGLFPGFLYEDGKNRGKYKNHRCEKKERKKKVEVWEDRLVTAGAIEGLDTKNLTLKQMRATFVDERKEKLKRAKDEPSKREQDTTKGQVSAALHIPRGDRLRESPVDIYTSGSCTSIYRNYPDLHIGGDHIALLRDSGCILDQECETADGPILLSMDGSPCQSSHFRTLQKPPAHKLFMSDDIRDKSFLVQGEQLSSSLLNGYMEKKVEELYKQFFADNLTLFGSPTKFFSSSFFINNVNQMSVQISQEQNVEASLAREVLLHHLRSAVSSEFNTPSLRISQVDGRKKFDRTAKIPPC